MNDNRKYSLLGLIKLIVVLEVIELEVDALVDAWVNTWVDTWVDAWVDDTLDIRGTPDPELVVRNEIKKDVAVSPIDLFAAHAVRPDKIPARTVAANIE